MHSSASEINSNLMVKSYFSLFLIEIAKKPCIEFLLRQSASKTNSL